MKIELNGSSNNIYIVDTELVTCTCPNFKYRCTHHPITSEKRLCKHLLKVYEDHPELTPIEIQNITDKIPENAGQPSEDGKIRYPRSIFDTYVSNIRKALNQFSEIKKFEFCGSYRRRCSMVSDLDVLIVLNEGHSIDGLFNYLENFMGYEKQWRGELKAGYLVDGFIHIDFKVVPEKSWYFALMHFTGSKYENIELRSRASHLGYRLNEYGLFNKSNDEIVEGNFDSELSIYNKLDLPYKEPWER